MPVFIFYSRQFVMYGWSDVVILLLIIIFGMRYIKKSEKKYLFGTLVLIGIGIWEYLWFAWFVIGFLLTIPLFQKQIKLKAKLQDSKFLMMSVSFLVLGFIPIILMHITHLKSALIPFIYYTVFMKSNYLDANNSDFINNFFERVEEFVSVLINPRIGLWFANVSGVDSAETMTYVYLILFVISVIIALVYIAKKNQNYKRIAGILIIIITVLVTSSFTVSGFGAIQLAPLLPFVFILIAKCMDVLIDSNKIKNRFSKIKYNPNLVIAALFIFVMLIQIPFIINNYDILENAPNSKAHIPYENLNVYLKENNLKPVSLSWHTDRNMVVYTNGEQAPILLDMRTSQEGYPENKKTWMQLETTEFFTDKHLFVSHIYPKVPDCPLSPLPENIEMKCMPYYLMESASKRTEKELKIIDFPLPDGKAYLRTFQIVN